MAERSENVRLALFGESNVGKSHYGGQLLSRIATDSCELKLRGAPSDLSAFDEVRRRLNQGKSAGHTPSGVYRESTWPVKYGAGTELELVWPDYAGEQVRNLIDTRRMGREWLERTQAAAGWLLIVRPKLSGLDHDIFSRPLGDLRKPSKDDPAMAHRSNQARLVELLQMLLYARGLHGERSIPPLAVLLSCWDELGLQGGAKPAAVFEKWLPLLASFIRSHWRTRAIVFGLSALGTELREDVANEEFVDKGPEHFGFVVLPDGTTDSDLTNPIVNLAKMAKA